MTIEEAIRAKLLTMDAVTAITTTIRPDEIAQTDRMPLILISVEDEVPQNDLSGQGGLVVATVVISAVSGKKSQARALSEAVRINGDVPGTGLAGFKGTAGDKTVDTELMRTTAVYYPEEDGRDTGFFAVNGIYRMMYQETI